MNCPLPVSEYSTLVFDCDGVVLNSNKIKTAAFYQAALPYGEAAAQAMAAYHVANGGVSRYKKFAHFLGRIVPEHATDRHGPDLEELLEIYGSYVRAALLSCEISSGLEALRNRSRSARWLIVSGGDENELRDIFERRSLAAHFDGGIFGSPDTKEEILAREIQSGNIVRPALFLGDSWYDHKAASGAGLDFVFVSGWTEFDSWSNFTEALGIPAIDYVGDLS